MNEIITIPKEILLSKIFKIRGMNVMLSTDLAELYGVEVKRLNEQVNRNISRFPDRYMFKLTEDEYKFLRSQIATLERGKHSKYPPYAFTEHGILMLSSVLRSRRAEKINILIIDTFIELNKSLISRDEILVKLMEIDKTVSNHEEKIKNIFKYLNTTKVDNIPSRKVGYKRKNE